MLFSSANKPASSIEAAKAEIICQNCDTSFVGHYCPQCGQHVKEIERPLKFMFVDFMGTVVSFDTRLVKTLIAILFRPGKLTRDFLGGRRARYMPPFRFYVFISFVMFLLVSTLTTRSIRKEMDKHDSQRVFPTLETEGLTAPVPISEDSVYKNLQPDLKKVLGSGFPVVTTDSTTMHQDSLKQMLRSIQSFSFDTDDATDNKYEATAKLVKEHPELYINKLLQFTSWALFLFMPIFAFFLWISFRRTKKHYIGHLIFSLNIHSFIFTIISICIGLALLFERYHTGWLGYLFLTIPVYQVIGVRKLYQRTWFKSVLKMTLVWFMYGFVLLIGLITLAVFSFIGI